MIARLLGLRRVLWRLAQKRWSAGRRVWTLCCVTEPWLTGVRLSVRLLRGRIHWAVRLLTWRIGILNRSGLVGVMVGVTCCGWPRLVGVGLVTRMGRHWLLWGVAGRGVHLVLGWGFMVIVNVNLRLWH